MATSGTDLSAFDPAELPDASGKHFGLVVAEWNREITEKLYSGARQTLLACGASEAQITRVDVPGTFELPYAAKLLCQQEKYDALIVIGTVIQGETRHFDFVCQGVTQGVMQLNMAYNTPVIFCVLTDNNKQQSIDRAGGKHGNKGVECAVAALKMAAFNQKHIL